MSPLKRPIRIIGKTTLLRLQSTDGHCEWRQCKLCCLNVISESSTSASHRGIKTFMNYSETRGLHVVSCRWLVCCDDTNAEQRISTEVVYTRMYTLLPCTERKHSGGINKSLLTRRRAKWREHRVWHGGMMCGDAPAGTWDMDWNSYWIPTQSFACQWVSTQVIWIFDDPRHESQVDICSIRTCRHVM